MRVREKSVFYTTVRFKDKNGIAMTPASASYRIDDVKSGTEIRDWTTIDDLSTSVELTISGDDNKMVDETNGKEMRELVIKWADSNGNEVKDATYYYVWNLKGVS